MNIWVEKEIPQHKVTIAEGGVQYWQHHVKLFTSLDISSGNVLINIIPMCRLEPNTPHFKPVIQFCKENGFSGRDLAGRISSSVKAEGKWDYVCLVFSLYLYFKTKTVGAYFRI